MLISLDLGNDIVGNEVSVHPHGIVEDNASDREVGEVHCVMDGNGDNRSVVIREDSRYTKEKSLVDVLVTLPDRIGGVLW